MPVKMPSRVKSSHSIQSGPAVGGLPSREFLVRPAADFRR